MPGYVKQGDDFAPEAKQWNSFEDAAEYTRQQKFNMNSSKKFRTVLSGTVCVKNVSASAIAMYSAVFIGSMLVSPDDSKIFQAPLVFSGIPAGKDSSMIGIALEPIPVNAIGTVQVFGLAKARITVNSEDHLYCRAESNGSIVTDNFGFAKILWQNGYSGSVYAALLVNSGSADSDLYEYNGPFKVTVSEDLTLSVAAGFLNRNGDFLTVPEIKSITAETGYLCACSSIVDKTETWTKPTVKFATPAATAYPVAYVVCDKDNAGKIKSVTVTQPLIVAQITQTKDCPVAVAAAESGN